MKAICDTEGSFTGLVPDIDTYEKIKKGTVDWKDTTKARMKHVSIPYKLFIHLMKLEIAVEAACARKKAEEEQSND